MKVFIIAALAGLVLFFGKPILSVTKPEIEQLMDFTFKNALLQSGPDGEAMFVIGVENLPTPYGYENIFFRVHDGGNRFYVTMFRKEIYLQPDGSLIVKSMKFIDGGSILRGNDEWGTPDGRPDRVVFNTWRIMVDGLILEETPETFIDLVPGMLNFDKYLELFDEGIVEIKKFYRIEKKGDCQGCE